jgi:hypothetical protein
MKTSTYALVLAFSVAMFAGCSQRIGDFTVISSKNVDIGGKYKMTERQTGSDSRPDVLLIPIGIPDLKQAVDNCIEAGKGDLLTNAVIDFSQWTAIVYGKRTYTVTGDVWVKASMSDLLDPDVELFQLLGGSAGLELVSVAVPTQRIKVDYFASR